jgi:serine/threonine protein kinase
MNEPILQPDESGHTEPGPTVTQELVQRILDDQRERCRRGEPFHVEGYLDQRPTLRGNGEAILDLIYHELMLRESRGETPTLEEYLGRFPEWAEQLKCQFEIERALEPDNLTRTCQDPVSDETYLAPSSHRSDTPAFTDSTRGADYEILAVLGQGGMGAVYKARQRSLNRIVALKVIRAGSLAGPDERARFRIEAEAAARLQHPNIVQIFEVGERDDMPFLALEYVPGGSLAQKLNGAPWPPYQAAAFIDTLARAMHHAHLHGIVHRDLKPANILLSDERREANAESEGNCGLLLAPRHLPLVPKITDFGLAKIVREDESGLTQPGMFLGTPSYAAPEQAAGRIHEMGPPTDVYALGAILYELLTGRPPFRGASVIETLDQVRSREPTPPSRLGNKLPRDLETICLKCLQKDPRKRYASALLLAEDLQSFREGRPIRARPVGRLERLYKLVRRRPAAAAAIATFFLALVILTVGGWKSAITEKGLRRQAEANLARALEAVDAMLTRVAEVDLADVPQMEPVRKDLLVKARGFLDTFLEERGQDPAVRYLAAKAYSRLGDIQGLLEEHVAAEQAYHHALLLLGEWQADAVQTRQEQARVYNHLGVLLKTLNRLEAAQEAVEMSLKLRLELASEFPDRADFDRDVAASFYHLATIQARPPQKRVQARTNYDQALARQEKLARDYPQPAYQRDVAHTLNNLGSFLWTRNVAEAEKLFLKAIELEEKLVTQFPDVPGYRRELARTWNNLAGLQNAAGDRVTAYETYRRSLELHRELARDFPKVPIYRHELAGTYYNLARVLEGRGKLPEAEDAYRSALIIRKDLARDFPAPPDYRHKLALVQRKLGSLLSRRRHSLEAEAHLRDAVGLLKELSKTRNAAFQSDLGVAYNYLAQALARQGWWLDARDAAEIVLQAGGNPLNHYALLTRRQSALVKARDCLQEAIACQKMARATDPSEDDYKARLREHCEDLAGHNIRLGEHAAVSRICQELLKHSADGYLTHIRAAGFLSRCIPLAHGDARLTTLERQRCADLYAARAIGLLQEAVDHGFLRVEQLKSGTFAPLRSRPEFKALLEKLDKDKKRLG